MFARRLQAMARLGHATLRVAERVFVRRVQTEDDARRERLGDVDGQTSRAQAFAERLESAVLVDVVDPVTVKPTGWFR